MFQSRKKLVIAVLIIALFASIACLVGRKGSQAQASEGPPYSVPTQDKHRRPVFAHYFPPYPISKDNLPADKDYYTLNYLNPQGENGKFAYCGGLLRDRPLPRSPISGDWGLTDLRSEVTQASTSGIDGFTVDILETSGSYYDIVERLITAAESQPGFSIVLQPDMYALPAALTPDQLAEALVPFAAEKSVYHNETNDVVISPFAAELRPVSWWRDFITSMRQRGIMVDLLPIMVDPGPHIEEFAPISYGLGYWGAKDPAAIANAPNYADIAHRLGKKWMSPITFQDVRPNQGVYSEAANTETVRSSWARAEQDDADYALLITWNDYSENTHIAPSQNHHSDFLDINGYYMTRFQVGAPPTIKDDGVYITYRTHPFSAMATGQPQSLKLRGATQPRDTVEILTMLTAPANVRVVTPTSQVSYDAPSGVSTRSVPLAIGVTTVTAQRNSSPLLSVKTGSVANSITTQDLTYHSASAKVRPGANLCNC